MVNWRLEINDLSHTVLYTRTHLIPVNISFLESDWESVIVREKTDMVMPAFSGPSVRRINISAEFRQWR